MPINMLVMMSLHPILHGCGQTDVNIETTQLSSDHRGPPHGYKYLTGNFACLDLY